MRLEDQVCSLELAKRLKELGVKQESAFVWLQVFNPAGWILCESNRPCVNLEEDFRAYTVAELGEMLPDGFVSGKHGVEDLDEKFVCKNPKDFAADYQYSNCEADARAKMLIHLIEKGIVTP